MNPITTPGVPRTYVPNFNTLDTKNYIPDFVYSSMCADDCEDVCSNNVYSPVVGGYVHDPYNGKVFCPFGKGDSLNKSIMSDQTFMDTFNSSSINNYATTKWGHVPQLSPRPLVKVGLTWQTS